METKHFRTHVKHKIGGRAKAMVVTEGRLHAVRYKQSFDSYIAEKGYKDVKTLVAFSGIVEDPDVPGKSYTEVGMNGGIKESELPERFDSHEYQVLLVAEKYSDRFRPTAIAHHVCGQETHWVAGGSDPLAPKSHLRGQRRHVYPRFPQYAGGNIQGKPYYEDTPSEPLTDAQHLYRLQHQIEETHLIHEEEVKAFCVVYFKPRRKETPHDQAQMSGILDQAVERFQERDEEERETAKTLLVNFRNMYGFLSPVIPYQDSDLEQLYTYVRFLLTKLRNVTRGRDATSKKKWSCNTTAYKRSTKARSNSTQVMVNR